MTRLRPKCEEQIRGRIGSTTGMYGDLRGVASTGLNETQGLQIAMHTSLSQCLWVRIYRALHIHDAFDSAQARNEESEESCGSAVLHARLHFGAGKSG
jgi:hypothetical protein